MQETFINPYTFISISNKKKTGDSNSDNGSVKRTSLEKVTNTGYFECRLTTVTPLAIPDTEKDQKENEHKEYDAFHIGDKYAIPGSSIRGMLRSEYEAATNSCMVTMDEDEYITKRSDLGKSQPCVLIKEDNIWKLYKAKRVALVCKGKGYKYINGYKPFDVCYDGGEKYIKQDSERFFFGDRVKIVNGPEYYKGKSKEIHVWDNSVTSISHDYTSMSFLYIGEPIGNKHAESVFEITDKCPYKSGVEVDSAMLRLEATLEMYRNKAINRNLDKGHRGYKGYERAKRNNAIPLWFTEKDNQIYLSLASIGRVAFYKTMKDISNNHEPCKDRGKVCPACALFGMVGKGEGKKGLSSRIRVTDAFGSVVTFVGGNNQKVTLKELGAPRPSFLPFYSTGGKSYDEKNATIRGRKFYWHDSRASANAEVYRTNETNQRNSSMELIDVDNTFNFKVYFDDFTEAELKSLIWMITLGNRQDLCHKIGHGKPLGLGSVRITIEKMVQRDLSKGYSISDPVVNCDDLKSDELSGIGLTEWNKLEPVLKYDATSTDNISYPFVVLSEAGKTIVEKYEKDNKKLKDNFLASHVWFKEYRNKVKVGQNSLPDGTKKSFDILKRTPDKYNDFTEVKDSREHPSNRQNQRDRVVRDDNSAEKDHKCKICGKPVVKNKNTQEWYEVCRDCFQNRKRKN